MNLPYSMIFRLLAWLSLIGGLVSAWLVANQTGWLAAVSVAASALIVFLLWQAFAWGLEALESIKARATETARDVEQLLARQLTQGNPHPAMVFAKPNPPTTRPIADAPLWPNALVMLQSVATYNGVEIAAEANGQWTARKDGEATIYASAEALAAWLKTLPKP